MAHPIAQVGPVFVRAVVSPWLALCAQIGLDLRPGRLEQGLEPAAAPRTHAPEPGEPGAAQHPHQHGLELVVRSVSGGDRRGARAAGGGGEEPAPQRAQPRLAGKPEAPHAHARVPARPLERDAEPRAQLAHESQVGVGLGAAQAMMQVGGVHREAELARHAAQRQHQRDRVGPAAQRDQDAAARSDGAGPAKGPAEGRLQPAQAHGVWRGPGVVWWRRRDSNPGHRDYDSPALPAELRRPDLGLTAEGERRTLGGSGRGVKPRRFDPSWGGRPRRAGRAPVLRPAPRAPGAHPAALRSVVAASVARASSWGRMRKMRDSSLRSSPSLSRCRSVPR